RVVGATLGLGPKVTNVPEHLRQRDHCTDDLGATDVLHGLNVATAGVQVTDHIAHVVLGRANLDSHDGLEQDRVRLADGLLEHHGARDLERHLRGVDVVVGAVQQGRLDADQRVAREDTELHGLLDALVDAGDVLPRDAATGHGVLEGVELALAGVQRLEGHLHLRELAGATRLLLVGVVVLHHGAADGLAVGDLRRTDVGLDLELPLHAVDQDVEVELAHATDDGLAGLVVEADGEGRVLLRQLLDRGAELLLVTLGLGLDGYVDDRLREGHRLQDDRLAQVAQRVTGGGVLEPDHG